MKKANGSIPSGSARRPFEGEVQLVLKGLSFALKNASGKVSRRLDELVVVKGDQCLHRSVGSLPLKDACFTRRRIECHQGRLGRRAFPISIHASAIQIFSFVTNEFPPSAQRYFYPKPGGLVGLDSRAAEFAVEQSANGQGIVADELTHYAEAGCSGIVEIDGIFG